MDPPPAKKSSKGAVKPVIRMSYLSNLVIVLALATNLNDLYSTDPEEDSNEPVAAPSTKSKRQVKTSAKKAALGELYNISLYHFYQERKQCRGGGNVVQNEKI